MNSPIADEAAVQRRLINALRVAETVPAYPRNLSLHEAIEEVGLWVQDERQWRNTRGPNWESLLLDLDDALDVTGSALAAAGLGVAATRTALKECAAVLAQEPERQP